MKKVFIVIVACVFSTTFYAQSWTLDKAHAKLGFSITHLLISDIEGNFKTFDIKLTSSKADFTDAVIELTSEVKSINTDNEQRDKHLQSPDFFDAEKTPTLSFKSLSFTKVGEKNYKLVGNLTMHGITKPVTLDVILKGTAIHPYNKKTVAGFKITGSINRKDFAIGANFPEAVISEEVVINANAEFFKE